jgi:hypothetical protein
MIVTNNKSIQEVQQAFQQTFPYLKIEFYDTEQAIGEGSAPNRPYRDTSKTIGELCGRQVSTPLSVDEQLRVGALERAFYRQFGLNVRIFRRAGHCWLDTCATDHWTLGQQNQKGQAYDKRAAMA